MGKIIVVFTLLHLLCGLAKATQSFPPVGERVYMMDESEQPISIVEDEGQGDFMRDPVPVGDDVKSLRKPVSVRPAQQKIREAGPAKMNFKKKSILGRLTKPRLEFDLEPLPVFRVDEVVRMDLIDSIFRTAHEVEGHRP